MKRYTFIFADGEETAIANTQHEAFTSLGHDISVIGWVKNVIVEDSFTIGSKPPKRRRKQDEVHI